MTSCDPLPLHPLIAHVFSNLFRRRLRYCLVSFVFVVCVSMSCRIVCQGYYLMRSVCFHLCVAPGILLKKRYCQQFRL